MTLISEALAKAVAGEEPTPAEAEALFSAEKADFDLLCRTADLLRMKRCGDRVTFVVVRNINFSNICGASCRFCGFSRREGDPDARRLEIGEIVARALEARERGATELCMQGGIDHGLELDYHLELLSHIKAAWPDVHIHAYSPFEVDFAARRNGMPVETYLAELKAAGLGSMPGTAAEIFDPELRSMLAPAKISTERWFEIVRAAHLIGIRTTSTMMYGHIDGPKHWADHILRIRALQKETGGFTEFVPLGFMPWKAPIYLSGEARAGSSKDEHIRIHAAARVLLDGAIDNIQVSWVKLGVPLALEILGKGANDFGGTLMGENITRAAGGTHAEEMTSEEFVNLIRSIGRRPAQRDTLYNIIKEY